MQQIIGGMKQERIELSQTELKRIKVISALSEGRMSISDAALKLGLCRRQVIRLKKKFVAQGDKALIHGNRGRQPAHTIGDDVRNTVLKLFQDKYHDFNFSHFTDMLNEEEGVYISRASVARILASAGIRSKKHIKRRPKLHRGRPRKEAAGMLWQTDATSFEWFGEGNGYFTLHAYIDDATSLVVGAYFTKNECSHGYAEALKRGIEKYGLPMAIYSDRHAIFRLTRALTEDEIIEGAKAPLSDFGAALAELGIVQIFALTPEAKGRIERLWGTFQDRLAGEMRLQGISDIDAANKALPKLIARHNKKFAVKAQQEPVYVPLLEPLDFELLFAHRAMRKTDHSGTVSYKGCKYSLGKEAARLPLAKQTVEIRETHGGKLYFMIDKKAVEAQKVEKPITEEAPKVKAPQSHTGRKGHKPAADHPWRQYKTKSKESSTTSVPAAT